MYQALEGQRARPLYVRTHNRIHNCQTDYTMTDKQIFEKPGVSVRQPGRWLGEFRLLGGEPFRVKAKP
jgi:hypothetical protein